MKEIYEIKFSKSIMAKEYKQFFEANYNSKLKQNLNVINPSQIKISDSNNEIKTNMNYTKVNSIIYMNKEDSFEESEFPIKYINNNNNKIMETKIWRNLKGFINNTNKF